jgi:hypothetical protein
MIEAVGKEPIVHLLVHQADGQIGSLPTTSGRNS